MWRSTGSSRCLLLALSAAAFCGAAGDATSSYEKEKLLDEVARLREEVQKMKQAQLLAAGSFGQQQQPQQQPPLQSGSLHQAQRQPPSPPGLGQAAGREEASSELRGVQRELASLQTSLGQLSGGNGPLQDDAVAGLQGGRGARPSSAPAPADGCASHPLFVALQGALQKLALLEQDPVEASYQIHAAWEEDPALFDVCPAGLITALVYLSMAQDQDWKYRLLHRATYYLYSTPGLASQMVAGRWPMSDRLIRTLYHNSEVRDRAPLMREGAESQQRDMGLTARAASTGIDEAVSLAMQHRDSLQVHFSSVLFYHFYHREDLPCACRSRSWCLPHWLRYFTNHTVDIWLAARDEHKTLYRMDRTGCFRSLGKGLRTHHLAEAFDVVFVFEINAFMHPQCRIIPARRVLLYPTFELSSSQMANFEELGASVLADDALMKPPNAQLRQLLEKALEARQSRFQRVKDHLLLFPADIRPMKGQTDFLSMLLAGTGQPRSPALERLRGLTVVIAGACDGNETYCWEVVSLSDKVTAEGIVNVVVADTVKDEELAQLYAAALGVVLPARVDCNPRAIYEGLVTDTPFFVTEQTRLPPLIQHLGHVVTSNGPDMLEQLASFVEFCEAGGFTGRPKAFAQRHLLEADVYREVVSWMETKFMSGKVLEPIIKSEDAMSGPLSGLTSLLGGARGLGGLGAAASGLQG